ncbi:hypothetical protein GQR58_014563 [Nymphon striatum]|nr:hypothetical protein GQR58_014563 [Nymphon striatum]
MSGFASRVVCFFPSSLEEENSVDFVRNSLGAVVKETKLVRGGDGGGGGGGGCMKLKNLLDEKPGGVVAPGEIFEREILARIPRLTCYEKLPPSEIARQEGTLKRPMKKHSDATAESYERSYTTPDGYQVKESKMYKSSQSHQEEHFGQSAPIRCHNRVIKLPADIVKRSSVVKSPVFDINRNITSPVQHLESTTTTTKREYHEETGTTKNQKTSVYESSSKDKSIQEGFSHSNMSPIVSKTFKQVKKESIMHQAPQIFTIEKQQSGTSTITNQEPLTTKEPNVRPKVISKPEPPKVILQPSTGPTEDIKVPEVKHVSTVRETVIKDAKVTTKVDKPKPIEPAADEPENIKEVTRSTDETASGVTSSVMMKSVTHQGISDGKKFESVTTETTEKDNGVLRTIDTKTQTMHQRNNEGALPNDHVTNEIGPQLSASSQSPTPGPIGDTTMPSVTNPSYASPSLFKVSKFSSETESDYSWTPSSQRSSQRSTLGKNGNTTTKRHSAIYEGRPTPPLPPSVKPPRPVSAPDLENNFLTFSEQIKQEICTPARRDAAEGEDRRSVSLEMIRKALIPPSDEEMKDTLIRKTKKKMFSSSSFYEEPNAIYPTVEEQFDLAKKIAHSLSSDTNRKSKGADMFTKRVKTANKWIHETKIPDIYSTTEMFSTKSVSKSDNGNVSRTVDRQYSRMNGSESESEVLRYNKLKPVLNPTRPQDSEMFKGTDREFKTQGLALSPDFCANLVQDLNNFKGKGAKIFAKRRKKSENWIVDESNVSLSQIRGNSSGKIPPAVPRKPGSRDPRASPQNRLNSMIQDNSWMQQKIKYVKSPWDAALKSPIGSCDSAFEVTNYKYVPPMPQAPVELLQARLPSMLNMEKSETPPPVSSSTLYKPKVPRGWARSVHVRTEHHEGFQQFFTLADSDEKILYPTDRTLMEILCKGKVKESTPLFEEDFSGAGETLKPFHMIFFSLKVVVHRRKVVYANFNIKLYFSFFGAGENVIRDRTSTRDMVSRNPVLKVTSTLINHGVNCRTISLISHSSKVLLKVIQRRITSRIEEVLDEAQAGFRKGADYKTVEEREAAEEDLAELENEYYNEARERILPTVFRLIQEAQKRSPILSANVQVTPVESNSHKFLGHLYTRVETESAMVTKVLAREGLNCKYSGIPVEDYLDNKTNYANKTTRFGPNGGIVAEIDFEEFTFIFLPICTNGHWILFVADMVNHSVDILNSLDWDESRHKLYVTSWQRARGDEAEWSLMKYKSCKQEKGHSCGVFVIMNAEAIAKGVPPRVMRQENQKELSRINTNLRDYFGHMVRGGGMARAILEGGVEGSRGRGRPMGNWLRNLKEWSGQAANVLTCRAEDRVLWRNSVRAWVHPRLDPG